MSVSILIIAHNEVGTAIINTVTSTLGELPLPTTAIAVHYDTDPDELLPKLQQLTSTVDHGDGVLILTDMFGSTPFNIAKKLSEKHAVKVVSGLNLPMVIRVMNYPALSLDELAEKALSGGKDGIINCEKE